MAMQNNGTRQYMLVMTLLIVWSKLSTDMQFTPQLEISDSAYFKY